MSAFIGSGRVRIAPYDAAVPFGSRIFGDLGNTSAFTFNFSENRQELRDYRDPAGGVDASAARIEAVNGSMDARHFTAANLAMAVWGNTNVLGATPITGESHKARFGKFVPTNRLINTSVPPVVTAGADTVLATDYVVSAAGITFIATPTTVGLTDGEDITIAYTPVASNDVQALLNAAPNVSIFFDGVNTVDNKRTTGRWYKCKLGVASDLPFIGDDFGTLPITFTVEKDETIVGAGKSQFFEIQQEA